MQGRYLTQRGSCKYSLDLHFPDEVSEAQRLDHLFYVTQVGNMRLSRDTGLWSAGCCSTFPSGFLPAQLINSTNSILRSPNTNSMERLSSGSSDPPTHLKIHIIWMALLTPNDKTKNSVLDDIFVFKEEDMDAQGNELLCPRP